jgi:hypothetical protein
VINVPGNTPEATYSVAEEVTQGLANTPDTFWKLSDADITAMDGAGYFRYQCSTCVDRFIRTQEQQWSSIKDNGLTWEEDRNKDEIFECDAVARSNYVFSDYPATPLIDGEDCTTAVHTNYGEGSGNTGCYAAACGGWAQPASVWVRSTRDVCVPLDGEPHLNGNVFFGDIPGPVVCGSFGMEYTGGVLEQGRRVIDFIWYPVSREDTCGVGIGGVNQYGGTVMDIQGLENDAMCLVHWEPADSEPIISHIQCECIGSTSSVPTGVTIPVTWIDPRNAAPQPDGGLLGNGNAGWGECGAFGDSEVTSLSSDQPASVNGIQFRFTDGHEEMIMMNHGPRNPHDAIYVPTYSHFGIYKHLSTTVYYFQPGDNFDGRQHEDRFEDANDIFALRLNGEGFVEYIRNGEIFFTSTVPAEFPAFFESELVRAGEVSDATLCTWGGSCGDVAAPSLRPPPPTHHIAPPHVPANFATFGSMQINTCYRLMAENFDAVMHEEPGDGSCSDGDPVYAQTSERADSFRFVQGLCSDGDQCGDPNDPSVVSIESCQSPGKFLRHCNFHIWAGDYGTGPNYDFMWQIRPGSDGVTVQIRTTADQFGERDMEVIPGADNRVTMVEDGNHENWYLIPAHTEEEAALGLVGCYQDCSTDAEGNTADRVCDEVVSDVQSIEQCQVQCTEGGYAYMGMACPRADAFECWCCNDFDLNSAGRHSLIPTQECSGGELTSGVNGNRQDHCSGFSGADDGYTLDGYYLGGHCRAAIYDLAQVSGEDAPAQQIRGCEGETVSIACDGDNVINILDAVYGRQHGPDVCPHAATADQNCHAVESVNIVNAACRGQSSCTVAATNSVFGDPCGGTYKYLTVDYECISPASLAVLPPPPPPVGPPEVFAEYDAIEMNVCYQLKARDFDVVMHEEPGDGSCSDGDPIYAQTSGRADSFRFVPALCTDGGQCGDPNDPSVVSIESCQSPGKYLRHCSFHIWAGEYSEPNYDFMWQIRPGSDGLSVQIRTTADQFGERDMEVISENDNRVTMVEDGNHEDWYLIPAHTEEEDSLGLVGCYQDCSTSAEGHTADRVCDDVHSDVQTVEQCEAQCTEGGYAYMGMACPRADAFECWCCNDLDENSAGRHSLIPTQECSGGELTSGVNGNRQDHCSGFTNAGDGGYVLDGFYLGGHCRAAVYEIGDEVLPALPSECQHEPHYAAFLTFLGETEDLSPNNHNAMAHGDAYTDFSGAYFDADGDWYSIANFDYASDGSFSIAFWYTKETCSGGIYEYLYSHNKDESVSIEDPTNSNVNMYLYCRPTADGGTLMREYLVDSAGNGASGAFFDYLVESSGDFDLTTARWNYHGLVVAPGLIQVFLDGQLLGPENLGARAFDLQLGGFDLRTDIHIGSRADHNVDREFQGSIALLQIYSTTVSSAEASCMFERQEVMMPAPGATEIGSQPAPTLDSWESGAVTNANGRTFTLYLLPPEPPNHFSFDATGARRYADLCIEAGLRPVTGGAPQHFPSLTACSAMNCMPLTSDYGNEPVRWVHDNGPGWESIVMLDVIAATSPLTNYRDGNARAGGWEHPLRPVCGAEHCAEACGTNQRCSADGVCVSFEWAQAFAGIDIATDPSVAVSSTHPAGRCCYRPAISSPVLQADAEHYIEFTLPAGQVSTGSCWA